jgi:hypothetical protein
LASKLNELGILGTGKILKSYDTSGEAIEVDGKKYSGKGEKKEFRCPHGVGIVDCYFYQCNSGGVTYVPLEVNAGLIGDNTLRLDKILNWKYANLSGDMVCKDMEINHLVKFSKTFVQNSVRKVGEFFAQEEEAMSYDLPSELGEITHICLSRDGY